MNQQRVIGFMACLVVSAYAPSASALTVLYQTKQHAICAQYTPDGSTVCNADTDCSWSGGACTGLTWNPSELWTIGMVDLTTDAIAGRVAVICVEDINNSDPDAGDTIFTIGGTAGLNDNYVIHSDVLSSAGNNDTVVFVQFAGYETPYTDSHCHRQLAPPITGPITGTWAPLLYNNFYLDFDGEEGNDIINNGYSYANTYLFGGPGADRVMNRSTLSVQIYGGADNDGVCSSAASAAESLYGEAGVDCLYDWTFDTSYLSCGPHPGGFSGLDSVRHSSAGYFGDDGSCEILYTSGSPCTCS